MRSARHQAITVCLALAIVTSGCVKESSTDSSPSSPSSTPGRIEFSVTPTSVSWMPLEQPGTFSSYCNSANQTTLGPFVWSLRETGGGTVTVTTFTARATASNGALISDLTQLIGLLASSLTGTTATSIRLAPNQSLTSPERYTCQASQQGAGYPIFYGGSNVVYTVSGTDSNSTAVSSSATLNVQPVF
jgi:hypothetical protein